MHVAFMASSTLLGRPLRSGGGNLRARKCYRPDANRAND
jgi:hypothetical protein